MQTTGKLFDDVARMASGAAGTLSGVRHEIEQTIRARLERMLADMDLVRREEFEAVREMAAKARAEQDTLNRRIEELEARIAAGQTETAKAGAAGGRAPSRKSASRTSGKSPGKAPGTTPGKSAGEKPAAGDSRT